MSSPSPHPQPSAGVASVPRVAPVLATAFLLRSLITVVPPALTDVRAELGLSEAVAGLTVGLPVICFGVFAFAAPFLLRRLGSARTMAAALVLVTTGAFVRPLGSVATLLAGTAAIGVGIAVGNVLVPVVIRRSRPAAVSRFMGYYTVILSLGAALGSLLTGPLLAAGVGWRAVWLGWALLAGVVTVTWMLSVRSDDAPSAPAPVPLREVARLPRAWLITVFMGLQSAVFYACTTWLPTQLEAVGKDVAKAALGLALFNAVGIAGSFLAPRMFTGRRGVPMWVVLALGYAGGLLLLLAGGAWSWIALMVAGFVQGAVFTLALTFIARTPDPRLVGGLSAFTQGVGYLIAAAAPSGAGALHAAAGSWWPVQFLLAGLVLAVGALGLRLVAREPDAR